MKFILLTIILTITATAEPVRLSQESQSPKQGEAVRLPDGRIVPYSTNPADRTLCQENCQPEEMRQRRGVPVWALTAGAVAGGILIGSLSGSKATVRDVPPATPAQPQAPPFSAVPEPATIILLASGLLLAAWRAKRVIEQPGSAERRELLRQLRIISQLILAAQAAGDWQLECLHRAAARDVSVRLVRLTHGQRRADLMMATGH